MDCGTTALTSYRLRAGPNSHPNPHPLRPRRSVRESVHCPATQRADRLATTRSEWSTMTPRARISTFLALAGAAVLGTSATASAADYQLSMSGPATAAVGQPAVYQVQGQNPPPTADPFLK